MTSEKSERVNFAHAQYYGLCHCEFVCTSSYSQLHPHCTSIRPCGRDALSRPSLIELALVRLELFSLSSVAHGWTSPLASTEYMMAPARYISAAMMNTTLHWSCRTLTSVSGCRFVRVCVCECTYVHERTWWTANTEHSARIHVSESLRLRETTMIWTLQQGIHTNRVGLLSKLTAPPPYINRKLTCVRGRLPNKRQWRQNSPYTITCM